MSKSELLVHFPHGAVLVNVGVLSAVLVGMSHGFGFSYRKNRLSGVHDALSAMKKTCSGWNYGIFLHFLGERTEKWV